MKKIHLCKVIAGPDPFAERDDLAYDLRHMKIYVILNPEKNEFRARLDCTSCGDKGPCMCYDSLESAICAQEERECVLCDKCLCSEGYTDEDIENMDFPSGLPCNL